MIRLVSNVKRKRNRKQEEKVDCAYELKKHGGNWRQGAQGKVRWVNRSVVFGKTQKRWGEDGERCGEELAAGGEEESMEEGTAMVHDIHLCGE